MTPGIKICFAGAAPKPPRMSVKLRGTRPLLSIYGVKTVSAFGDNKMTQRQISLYIGYAKECNKMRALSIISLVLMVIGALNWLLIGLFGFNVVTAIFGFSTAGIVVTRIIYLLVGLAGIYGISMLTRLSESRDDICVPGHVRPVS